MNYVQPIDRDTCVPMGCEDMGVGGIQLTFVASAGTSSHTREFVLYYDMNHYIRTVHKNVESPELVCPPRLPGWLTARWPFSLRRCIDEPNAVALADDVADRCADRGRLWGWGDAIAHTRAHGCQNQARTHRHTSTTAPNPIAPAHSDAGAHRHAGARSNAGRVRRTDGDPPTNGNSQTAGAEPYGRDSRRPLHLRQRHGRG